MTEVLNPYRELETNITPKEFELFCLKTLESYANEEGLNDFEIKHNQILETNDGVYQIDILAEFTALGVKNRVIIECKKYGRPVERGKVAELYSKIQSLGANKGILISTSGFQTGATQFAKTHGIALWQICDNYIKKMSASADNEEKENLYNKMYDYLPNFFVLDWDCNKDYPLKQIYPTYKMEIEAIKKVSAILHKNYFEENK